MRESIAANAQIHPVDGTAEATTLHEASVDIVTAFQAYHWFDPPAVMREALRITKPRARFAAVWNHRDRNDPFTGAFEAIVDRYDISGGNIDRSRRMSTIVGDLTAAGWTNARKISATHEQPLRFYALLGFVRSASYLPREGELYDALIEELATLFEREVETGGVRFRWQTEAYVGDRS